MLFLFERTERQTFWMKDCLVSLDMVWLDEALRSWTCVLGATLSRGRGLSRDHTEGPRPLCPRIRRGDREAARAQDRRPRRDPVGATLP